MTSVYKAKHGTNVSDMQKYLVSATSVIAAAVSSVVPTSTPTASPTSAPNPTSVPARISPTSAPKVTLPSKCIITLWGKQYDVTALRSIHGMDVFTCNVDQTAIYQSYYGTDLTQMKPYLVATKTTTSTEDSKSDDSDEEEIEHQQRQLQSDLQSAKHKSDDEHDD
jgi:hypothetical protein